MFSNCLHRAAPRPAGFTLIELLVVIAIIALLISILLPVLQSARNEGTKSVCYNALREILGSHTLYESDNGGSREIPWYQIPVHGSRLNPNPWGVRGVTPWVFGGFRAPLPISEGTDSSLYPAQIRPLSRYIDPTAQASTYTDENYLQDRGADQIKTFICPGDRSHTTGPIGAPATYEPEESVSSHQGNGSSFSLNTRFYQGYWGANFNFLVQSGWRATLAATNAKIARNMVGGGAARFAMWVEQGFYAATQNAGPTIHRPAEGGITAPQRFGWHRRWSSWTVGFADGHVNHGYWDTRQIFGLDGTTWQPNQTRPGPPMSNAPN
jgi:prepilin-type N-terminal cleavage/methylation domain-containing protein